jgi:hypothetical protein
MVRVPPFRLGIWKVVYFITAGCLYATYASADGLNFKSCATSFKSLADFKEASDMSQICEDPPALFRDRQLADIAQSPHGDSSA